MDLTAILAKTAKGQDEISTRQNKLPARIRTLLIMVDGKRPASELVSTSANNPDAALHLQALLDDGFIEVLTAASPSTLPASQPGDDISLAKNYVSKTLYEMMGPDAESFALRVEGSKSADELLSHVIKLGEILETTAGKKKADQFREKMSLVLS